MAVKQKHKHIIEMACIFLWEVSLPIQFWVHATHVAAYVINHLPTLTLDYPFLSSFFHKKHHYSFVEFLGANVYESFHNPASRA